MELSYHPIPRRAHRWQSDVKTVNRLIGDEFYEVELFTLRANFLAKATTCLLRFSVARKNSYKENQTPWEISQAREPRISPRLNTLAPFFLDTLFHAKLDSKFKWGNDRSHPPALFTRLLRRLNRQFVCQDALDRHHRLRYLTGPELGITISVCQKALLRKHFNDISSTVESARSAMISSPSGRVKIPASVSCFHNAFQPDFGTPKFSCIRGDGQRSRV